MARWFSVHPRRLRTMPALRELTRGDESTRFAVDGLVCGVCAMRTGSALARVRGVRSVRVDLDRGIAEIDHAPGAAPDAASLERALASVVVARGVRRWLADGLTWSKWRQWGVR